MQPDCRWATQRWSFWWLRSWLAVPARYVAGRRRGGDSFRRSSRRSLRDAPTGRRRPASWRDPRSSHDALDFDRRVAQVQVVDPHHPLYGSCLPVSDRRSGRGPGLIVVRLPDGRERAILRSATDLAFGLEGSAPTVDRCMHISVRTLLPLANHIRAVLASGHEDFAGGSRPARTARPEHVGPDRNSDGAAAPVASSSSGEAEATGAAIGPASPTLAAAACSDPGDGGRSC